MQRMLSNQLVSWKTLPSRMPLLLRGARQTGKTYLIEQFAQQHFEHFVNINFELAPAFKNCFDTLDPTKILQKIDLLVDAPIVPGKTLLFFDEIQECPEAIVALRYFKEQLPELHVVGAGSLLEFVLNQENFRMPVGRVEFLHLYPLNFMEFLLAIGENKLHAYLTDINLHVRIDQVVHNKLLELTRFYFVIGGMPSAINAYLLENNFTRPQQIQANILNTYKGDFGKYAEFANPNHCQLVFEKAPYLTARNFKYVDLEPDVQSRSLKIAVQALTYAGIIRPVYAASAQGLPLSATINKKKFKLLFLDTGLVNYATHVSAETLLNPDFYLVNRGAVAEQFVGQELLAYQPSHDQAELFYWVRDKRSSSAEVDYLVHLDQTIVPIEVKAGKTGRLKSLQLFRQEKNLKFAIKISQDEFSFNDNILALPFYLISQWQRLLGQAIKEP